MSLYGPRIFPSPINAELVCRKTQTIAERILNDKDPYKITCCSCAYALTDTEAIEESEKQFDYFSNLVFHEFQIAVIEGSKLPWQITTDYPKQPEDPGGHFYYRIRQN